MKVNKNIDKSISWYFHRPAYWLVNILVTTLFLLLSIFVFSFLTYEETVKSNEIYSSIESASDNIEKELSSAQEAYKIVLDIDPKVNAMKFAKEALSGYEYIFAVAYASNPKVKEEGFYIYRSGNQVKRQKLSEIYNTIGTKYYYRKWFSIPLSTRKPHMDSIKLNWFGGSKHNFTATYSFPFINNCGEVTAVGAFDVDVDSIISEIREKMTANDIHVYISIDDNVHKSSYVRFTVSSTKIVSKDLSFNKGSGWHIQGLSMYHRESLVYDGIVVVIKIGLQKPMLIALATFIILLFSLFFINIFLSRILRKKIDKLTMPIVQLSNYMDHIVENKNLDKQIIGSNLRSLEVKKLYRSVEKMRLDILRYIEIQKELNTKKSELYLAKQIQEMFMSDVIDISTIKHIDIATHYSSAEDLSGDIYDLRLDESDNLWILIGDSMGKNSAASIFSLFLLAKFRFVINLNKNPKEVIDMLNKYMCSYNKNNMFISCICIKIDFKSKKIHISNAGHDKPIIFSNDSQSLDLKDGYIVLGIDSEAEYSEDIINMNVCKSLFLYTDGLSEVKSSKGLYGAQRIKKVLEQNIHLSASDQMSKLFSDINSFKEASFAEDDKTAILIKFLGDKNNEK
ncbi:MULTISPECIES: SpoIIE family protein phosphatase [unclassified Francisella]|uniref:SpoIIE family protein phosphatase n=1 Tax=unclassified Francisella TaxID=2610885 RepID=UPI002E33C5C0|nr:MULTISPECIES: SpoIIE family protein phosphatase [unclassified Francisella]MED7818401.1 SpoIIE family protein phosphatase [Francisella sp. 19S2-4]MED7829237.1 SpoIIE family protein phosphatase [Francisella sp. 19S2-10]